MSQSAFADQVVVLTGAAGHIGAGVAAALAGQGAAVVCLDVVEASRTTTGITNDGGAALGLVADLREAEAVTQAFGEALAWRGRVDALVNMAGVFYGVPRVPFWEIDPDTWATVVDSNMRTAFLCAKAASEPMRAAGHGRIVNVSSNTSVFGMANFLHYVGAKAGIVGMTRGMARELGPFGIGVNAVAPGLVHTARTRDELAADYLDTVVAGQCLRFPLEVADVVNAVMFLASPASRMITGQTLLVNGGASMGPF